MSPHLNKVKFSNLLIKGFNDMVSGRVVVPYHKGQPSIGVVMNLNHKKFQTCKITYTTS